MQLDMLLKKDELTWQDILYDLIKTESRLGNKWIFDNTLYYEVIYEEDLNIEDGHIDIKLTKGLSTSSYLKGATIKVQKKNGRTRVLVYDFEMDSDSWGSAYGFGDGFGYWWWAFVSLYPPCMCIRS